MPNSPLLKQLADERAALVGSAAPRACEVAIDRGHRVAGFVWRADLIVAGAEAIAGRESVGLTTAAGEVSAAVLATDLGTDVAVLRAARELTAGDVAAAPARASSARAGEEVVAVGRRGEGVVAQWMGVRAVGPAWHSRRGGLIEQRVELDVRLDPSLEGAPVVNADGGLIGMAVPGPQRRALVIPYATLERVLEIVAQRGYLPRPFLGLRLQPVWLDASAQARLGRDQGRIALVAGVEEGSPAEAAGVGVGDLLLGVDSHPVADTAGLARRLATRQPGDLLQLELRRGAERVQVSLRVGERRARS